MEQGEGGKDGVGDINQRTSMHVMHNPRAQIIVLWKPGWGWEQGAGGHWGISVILSRIKKIFTKISRRCLGASVVGAPSSTRSRPEFPFGFVSS